MVHMGHTQCWLVLPPQLLWPFLLCQRHTEAQGHHFLFDPMLFSQLVYLSDPNRK